MPSTYAIVVIVLFASCIIAGIVMGVRYFTNCVVGSMSNHRDAPYMKEEYTRKVIKKRGLTEKAEKIMRDANDVICACAFLDKYRILSDAYKKSLALVREYMDDDELYYVDHLSCYNLVDHSETYRRFFGEDVYDPYKKLRYILS